MEPRSWKWIQAAAVAVALAVGIGVALWYQNRPVADALPAPAVAPARKTVRHLPLSDSMAFVAPVRSGTGKTFSAAAGTSAIAAGPDGAAPYQSAGTSGQRAVVDPMVHLQVPPSPANPPPAVSLPAVSLPAVSPTVVPPGAVSTAPPVFGTPPGGVPGAAPPVFPSGTPPPSAFSSASPPAPPASPSAVSPFAGAASPPSGP